MTNPVAAHSSFTRTIDDICQLPWSVLSEQECVHAAWAYYYFSVQFRETLKIARQLHPADEKLLDLEQAECDTDNLSPWPGVAMAGEKMDHDEFMRRSLALGSIPATTQAQFDEHGQHYLALNPGNEHRKLRRRRLGTDFHSHADNAELAKSGVARLPAFPVRTHPV